MLTALAAAIGADTVIALAGSITIATGLMLTRLF